VNPCLGVRTLANDIINIASNGRASIFKTLAAVICLAGVPDVAAADIIPFNPLLPADTEGTRGFTSMTTGASPELTGNNGQQGFNFTQTGLTPFNPYAFENFALVVQGRLSTGTLDINWGNHDWKLAFYDANPWLTESAPNFLFDIGNPLRSDKSEVTFSDNGFGHTVPDNIAVHSQSGRIIEGEMDNYLLRFSYDLPPTIENWLAAPGDKYLTWQSFNGSGFGMPRTAYLNNTSGFENLNIVSVMRSDLIDPRIENPNLGTDMVWAATFGTEQQVFPDFVASSVPESTTLSLTVLGLAAGRFLRRRFGATTHDRGAICHESRSSVHTASHRRRRRHSRRRF
jgi:hypothetical protein